MLAPWKKSYDQLRQRIKKQRHYFANKGPSSQNCGFSSGHVWMWELDHKENWVPKNWYFWTVVLEKTLESPLDCKEIRPVHHEGNQSWIFIGRTNAEAETPMLWPPDVKSWLIGKDPDAGRDWGQEEKGTTEDEMPWMASLTQWTWVCVNFGRWWWTELQHHSLQRNPRADLFQNGLVGSPCSPRDSQESSPTPQFKSIYSLALSLLHSPTLTSINDHWL